MSARRKTEADRAQPPPRLTARSVIASTLLGLDPPELRTSALVAGAAGLVVGDPTDERTEMGPMARADLRAVLRSQVERSVAAGAVVLTGGSPRDVARAE